MSMASAGQKLNSNDLEKSAESERFDPRKLSIQIAPKPVIIVIENEKPCPTEVEAPAGGRVEFQNNDNQGYMIHIQNIVTLDHYLPAYGTLIVFVNKAAQSGSEIRYDVEVATAPPGSRGQLAVRDLMAESASNPGPSAGTQQPAYQFMTYTAPGGKIIVHP
jgi:hypothetical protein